MRLANSFESIRTPEQEQASADSVGDALASACLFGIVGGLVFALVLVPAVSVILAGAAIGAVGGIAIAYH